MLPITSIINEAKMRINANDGFDNSYSDEKLLTYVNSAIRFIRRTIIKANPMYLSTGAEMFNVVPNQDTYELANNMAIIVGLLLDNKAVKQINIFRVNDHSRTGTPTEYWISNGNVIHLCPIPEKAHTAKVFLVASNSEVGLNDFSPFQDELDDFITEYVVVRAQMGYWFDTTQETSLMRNIYNQIVELVTPYTESFDAVDSY